MNARIRIIGNGPGRVLALHGWFGSASDWGPMADLLDGDRFTYAFLDFRGYGGAKEQCGAYTLDEMALDALAAADWLQWSKFALLGHSMGGCVIQRVLLHAPGRVTALTGIAPVPACGSDLPAAAWDLFVSAASNPAARRAIIDRSTGSRLSGRWLDRMCERSLANSRQDAFAAYLPAWARADFSEHIVGRTLPVGLFVGEHDPGLGPETMHRTWMRWYPNASLTVMRNAGHYPMEETPVAMVSVLENFLVTVV